MSECVVRMEMPTLEKGCKIAIGNEYMFCQIEAKMCNFYELGGKCPSWCPIVCSLPEGHGRLGDLDALLEQHKQSVFTKVTDFTEGQRSVVANIKNAPIIVPAEAERSEI